MATSTLLITLLAGFGLALSGGVWLALVWAGVRAELLQFYLALLVLLALWTFGVNAAGAAHSANDGGVVQAMLVLEIGYLGAAITLLALISATVRVWSGRVRLALLALVLLIVLYGALVQSGLLPAAFDIQAADVLITQQSYVILLGPVASIAALGLLWAIRQRQRDPLWWIGAALIAGGQLVVVLLPSLRGLTIALAAGAAGMVLLGLGLLEREVVRPAREQASQVEALRTVTSAITSVRPLDLVLEDLAHYTASLLGADVVGIFLVEGDRLALRMAHGLPQNFLGRTLSLTAGMAGRAVSTLRTVTVEDYARDWTGESDLPFARDVVGAALCEPLVHGGRAIGSVLVAIARSGRGFDPQDRALLQLLTAQGAVALQQNRLLSEQRTLNDEVETGRRQLESVLSSTESPVVAVTRDRHVLFANPAARVLASSANVDLSATVTAGLPRAAFPRSLLEAARELRRRGSFTYEVILAGRSFLCHAAPLSTGRMDGWVVVLNDVTELKALDRMKSDMMRMTSHDLKNPLQAAMANLELLRDDIYSGGSADVRESLDAVDEQLQRMYRIISGILDTERARTRLMTLAICRPDRIIEQVAGDLLRFARERGVALEAEAAPDLPDVQCDVEQFERALGNLVENGIKYTPAGGSVRLTARANGPQVVFEVADTGVGIPPSIQPHVFERFYRGRQPGVEDVAGTGVGLSLVKSVVENHQGTVWFESEVGAGTRFYVQLPSVQRKA